MANKEKKAKKKMVALMSYNAETNDVDVEVLTSPDFDPAKAPKIKKHDNGDISITSNDQEVVIPASMWNHGAGFGGITIES